MLTCKKGLFATPASQACLPKDNKVTPLLWAGTLPAVLSLLLLFP